MPVDTNDRVERAAQMLYDAFESATRQGSNETYYRLKDDKVEWMAEVVRTAHEGSFPDDWIYETCMDMAGKLADGYDNDEEIEGDIYTSDLYKWLKEVPGSEEYVDEAVRSFGWPEGGITAALGLGSMEHKRAIFHLLRQAIEENIDEIVPEEGEGAQTKCFNCGEWGLKAAMFHDDFESEDMRDYYCLTCAAKMLDDEGDAAPFTEEVVAAIREARVRRDAAATAQAE